MLSKKIKSILKKTLLNLAKIQIIKTIGKQVFYFFPSGHQKIIVFLNSKEVMLNSNRAETIYQELSHFYQNSKK